MPYTVGLTGGIGSGKSAAAARFAALGITVVDTDEIAHSLTRTGGAAIEPLRAAFGDRMIAKDGALDRAAMRERVFSDTAARARLEAILHPLIRTESAVQVAQAATVYAILMVPLLVESGDYRARCDRIAVVDCPESLQIERVIARSGLSEAQVRAVMAAQASRTARLDAADDVIDNSGSLEALQKQVDALDRRYRALASALARLSG